MKDRKVAAEHIFCSMGMIDSSLIAQAQTPTRARMHAGSGRRLMILVAVICSFALIVASLGAGFIIANLQNLPTADRTTDALYDVLQKAEGQAERLSKDELPLFDGSRNIIWRAENETEYYVMDLSAELDSRELKKLISDHGEELSPSKAEKITYEVWLTAGDGTVFSPYLKSSEGNVGYGELFSYSPEVTPTSELADIVRKLTS